MATAQTASRGGLSVDAAGAAAALRSHGRGRAVPVWDVLGLPSKRKEVTKTSWGGGGRGEVGGLIPRQHVSQHSPQWPPPSRWSPGW